MASQISVYLAGPGVFRPDAAVWGARLKSACEMYGLQGLFPLDANVPPLPDHASRRQWIFQQNCTLISRSNLVLADLRAFRSQSEPDSGTAFEVGFAYALGKPVWVWVPDADANTPMYTRVPGAARPQDRWVDKSGLSIEDFGVPLNLMLWQAAAGIICENSPEQAVEQLVRRARLPVLR
ncbi:nucleoside 2-deoxyribosyltransferase [Silvimonas iriomotensis]|uniref:Nucleoside 2-deoxyribosyltransferase n=1 Tax=Silvimonas iriomotensis TaxID=449662 RepID=A0ABQ2PBZ2_9NEIS|nr:nucleoside 2-deoxyribosyltransferase [Silvimonas iriomotensis]GGP22893.1 hypothetical protein GCM10010970_28930 [Silvimonas iriomotensis]